jgi:predicted ArsR family transcriptional regulator
VIRINALSFAKLVRCVVDDPATADEAAEETGLHPKTASRYLRALHRERLIHVCQWEKDALGRDRIPVYAFGSKRDRPKAKRTAAERHRAYRAQLKLRAMLARVG